MLAVAQTVTSVTNAGASVNAAPPGTKLQINGNGFGTLQGSNFLSFDGFLLQPPNPVVFQGWNNTVISFTVPDPTIVPAGNHTLYVWLWDGSSQAAVKSNGVQFTVQPVPLQIFSLSGGGTTSAGVYTTNAGSTILITGGGLQAFVQGTSCIAPTGRVNLTSSASSTTSDNYSYDYNNGEIIFSLPTNIAPGSYELFLSDGTGGASQKLPLTINTQKPSNFILRNGPQINFISPNPAPLVPGDIQLYGGLFPGLQGNGFVELTGSSLTQPLVITTNLTWLTNEVVFSLPTSLTPGNYNISVSTDSVSGCGKSTPPVPFAIVAGPQQLTANNPSGEALSSAQPGSTIVLSALTPGVADPFQGNPLSIAWCAPSAQPNLQQACSPFNPAQTATIISAAQISAAIPINQPNRSYLIEVVDQNNVVEGFLNGFSVTQPHLTSPNPIWGYADVHNHQFANLGFGGSLFWGEPFDPGGLQGALGSCILPHGLWHLADTIGHLVGQTFAFPNSGSPQFDGWPTWNSYDHQQVYMDWLFRAHQGGLQLMVMHAVNNELFCLVANRAPGFTCNDMDAAVKELQGAKSMEGFVDQQAGGPGKGWYRIVTTPQQARTAIANGQLAVVLGIEVDNLFGCTVSGNCTPAQVVSSLNRFFNLGVRHLFPLHVSDNGFGGAALYRPEFNIQNKIIDGYWFNVRDCSSDGVQFQLLSTANFTDWLLSGFVLTSNIGPPPNYTAAGQCNATPPTPLLDTLITSMMAHGMIIDVDHMSWLTLDRTLELVEPRHYPVVAGHTGFLDISIGAKRSEGQKSDSILARLSKLGALVAPILEQGASTEILPASDSIFAGPNPTKHPCSNSSWAWAQAYLFAVDKMLGAPVALGSDFNGFAGEPAPRFGSDGCAGNGTEMASQAFGGSVKYPFAVPGVGSSFSQNMVGQRTFNYNTDGMAHIGMYPDFIADLMAQGLTPTQLTPLFQSAEAYIELWERTSRSHAEVSPTSLIFGPTAPGAKTAAVTVVFSNQGGSPVNVIGVSLSGLQSSNFSETTNCASPLAVGSSCTISVSFAPLSTGPKTAALQVNDDAEGNPHRVIVLGFGQ
jgi:microsomal dipeptidase-like Zn-dependent dipeptidase